MSYNWGYGNLCSTPPRVEDTTKLWRREGSFFMKYSSFSYPSQWYLTKINRSGNHYHSNAPTHVAVECGWQGFVLNVPNLMCRSHSFTLRLPWPPSPSQMEYLTSVGKGERKLLLLFSSSHLKIVRLSWVFITQNVLAGRLSKTQENRTCRSPNWAVQFESLFFSFCHDT